MRKPSNTRLWVVVWASKLHRCSILPLEPPFIHRILLVTTPTVAGARAASGCGALDADGGCVVSGSQKLLRGDFDPADYNEQGGYAGDRKDMPMFGLLYNSGSYSVELWDYYVEDCVNMIYLYGDYTYAGQSFPG